MTVGNPISVLTLLMYGFEVLSIVFLTKLPNAFLGFFTVGKDVINTIRYGRFESKNNNYFETNHKIKINYKTDILTFVNVII